MVGAFTGDGMDIADDNELLVDRAVLEYEFEAVLVTATERRCKAESNGDRNVRADRYGASHSTVERKSAGK
jgi:hypothetical protein